ncbi:MAG: SRPBCC family protein [Cytophagaceae bacterium]|nr:SRPBCC family protein [Cytophagaceae bacterium]
MRHLKSIGIALLLAIIILVGVGFLLKPTYKVQKSIQIKAPADSIFPLIFNLKRWPEWTVWNTENDPTLEINYTIETIDSLIVSKAVWKGDELGKGKIFVDGYKVNKELRHDILLDDEISGKGLFSLNLRGKKTHVSWTIAGDVGFNIPQRYFILFFDNFIGADMQEGLLKLKKISEKNL